MSPINESPIEHHAHHGTIFSADRADLRNGLKARYRWKLTEAQKRADFLEFGAWHRSEIYEQLNGFQGYDCVLVLKK